VRISANHNFTGKNYPLAHDLVTDPTTDVGEVKERTTGKLAQLVLKCRSRTVVCRDDMIEEYMKFCRVPYPPLTHTLPGFKSKHTGSVMDIGAVNCTVNILSPAPVKDLL
jgi:hypothetical protein